jgi:hypothetical protein
MRKTVQLSMIAMFAALHAVLYLLPFGLWRNLAIYIAPIEGMLLGPQVGFSAALLGSSVARMLKPDDLWMFGLIAEPVSVLMAGFLARASWKPVFATYSVMLLAYFVHPFGRALPIWTVFDILIGLFLIYPAAKFSRGFPAKGFKRLSASLVLVSFVCVATDSLVRVFLLVPCGLYGLFFTSFEALQVAFILGAASSYIEDLLVVAISFLVGVPLVVTAFSMGILRRNERK